ncbi:MAG TPA: DUF2155 domain-containing protein [Alphaproteobacteria bacterium]|nr:DUF2155 domain-containing protein [Alphaproteobacteria bacterium]
MSAFAGAALAQDEMPQEQGGKKPSAVPQQVQPPSGNEEQEPPPAPPPGTMVDQPFATLQALDKVTARIKRITAKVGGTVPFGTLSIKVDACRKAPPEDPPESAAFLEITDARPGEAPQKVFSGWMFASSPALSAMDHPVYDISVVDCTSDATASATPAQ